MNNNYCVCYTTPITILLVILQFKMLNQSLLLNIYKLDTMSYGNLLQDNVL